MKYISLLRGINVSGQKSIKMDALRQLYTDLGLEDVSSYIQSGNIIFSPGKIPIKGLETVLQQAIKKRFGFDVPVLIRSHQQLDKIILAMPFDQVDIDSQGNLLLVCFLSSSMDKAKFSLLKEHVTAGEELHASNTEIYLYCPQGHGKSKLTNTLIEKKLGTCASTRNLKTLNKLYELMSQDGPA